MEGTKRKIDQFNELCLSMLSHVKFLRGFSFLLPNETVRMMVNLMMIGQFSSTHSFISENNFKFP